MSQPQGFVDNSFPHHVCLLQKAIYDLRQAPRAWYDRLSLFLSIQGFKMSHSDNSLFIRHTSTSIVVLLVYVDDILLTGSDTKFIRQLLVSLDSQFGMRLLGPVKQFLGIDIVYHDLGVTLSQQSYITRLLRKVGMSNCKPSPTPLVSKKHLLANDPFYENLYFYCSIVGAL